MVIPNQKASEIMKLLKHIDKYFIRYSFLAFIILSILSWAYIFKAEPKALSKLFDSKNYFYLTKFIKGLLGVGEENPAFLDKEMIKQALKLSYDTFMMSILATGIAAILMFMLVLFSAKNIANGRLTLNKNNLLKPIYYIVKIIFVISRSIPELMWAMILVFIFKPGIIPGALALAIHNLGVLGKLCSEVIEDIDEKPIRNLANSGASALQILFYAIIPDVFPKFINYILYRLENIIRATLIVGFVGAAGLGLQFKLAMSFFKYSEITLYLICYLILVYLTDIITSIGKKYIK